MRSKLNMSGGGLAPGPLHKRQSPCTEVTGQGPLQRADRGSAQKGQGNRIGVGPCTGRVGLEPCTKG